MQTRINYRKNNEKDFWYNFSARGKAARPRSIKEKLLNINYQNYVDKDGLEYESDKSPENDVLDQTDFIAGNENAFLFLRMCYN